MSIEITAYISSGTAVQMKKHKKAMGGNVAVIASTLAVGFVVYFQCVASGIPGKCPLLGLELQMRPGTAFESIASADSYEDAWLEHAAIMVSPYAHLPSWSPDADRGKVSIWINTECMNKNCWCGGAVAVEILLNEPANHWEVASAIDAIRKRQALPVPLTVLDVSALPMPVRLMRRPFPAEN